MSMIPTLDQLYSELAVLLASNEAFIESYFFGSIQTCSGNTSVRLTGPTGPAGLSSPLCDILFSYKCILKDINKILQSLAVAVKIFKNEKQKI